LEVVEVVKVVANRIVRYLFKKGTRVANVIAELYPGSTWMEYLGETTLLGKRMEMVLGHVA
jgi:hypothetical protein